MGRGFVGRLKRFLEGLSDVSNSWIRYILGDLSFVLLPLAVIVIIRVALDRDAYEVVLLPEWSFAAVVLFGQTITQTVELKARIQGDISWRLDLLIKFFVLGLILSVITLSLVVLYGYDMSFNRSVLAAMQFAMLGSGALFLGIVRMAKSASARQRLIIPPKVSHGRYYKYLSGALQEADDQLTYALFALKRHESLDAGELDPEVYGLSPVMRVSLNRELDVWISNLEVALAEVRAEYGKISGP